MKKNLFAVLAITAAISAQAAETIELLTNGDGTTLDGWNSSGFEVHNIDYWSDDDHSFHNDPFFSARSSGVVATMSQTVTLIDFGVPADYIRENPAMTASVYLHSSYGGRVCNVKVYELNAGGDTIATHTLLNEPSNNSVDKKNYQINFNLNSDARQLKYELNGNSRDDTVSYGPAFRFCSLKIHQMAILFVSEGKTIVTTNCMSLASVTPPTASREGNYRFLGYYTAETGGEQVYDENYAYSLGGSSTWTPTDGASLYAHWGLAIINFSFVSGDATIASGAYQTDGSGAAPHASRSGDYQFLGYFTEDDLKVFDEDFQFVQSALSSLSSDMTLYAHWAVPEGSVAKLVYRGQLTLLGTDTPATDTQKYEKTMHFRVYDDESATTPVWSADDQTVTVNKDGSFMVMFGDETLAALIATGLVSHVGVAIGENAGQAIELKPRREIRPVAVVNRALVAEAAGTNPRVGNLVTENALAANNVTISQLEVAGTVTAPGAGPVDVSPVVVGERETLTLLRGGGVNVFSKNRVDLGTTDNVQRGQKIGSDPAPSDGFALITSKKEGARGLRIPAVIQYCRKGEYVRAPASEPDGVKVTFFPFVGKEGK